MFKNFFTDIEWFQYLGLASMIIFFIAFIVMILWVIRIDKKSIEEQKNLPLKDK